MAANIRPVLSAWPSIVILGVAGWALFVPVAHLLLRNPRGDVASGFAWWGIRLYARVVHGLRIEGRVNAPRQPRPAGRPIIVAANHTAGIDPLLISAAVPIFVRFVMASDMRLPALAPLWEFAEVIFVDRGGRTEIAGMRQAIAHLKSGGTLGLFPEGRLARTPGALHPFMPGLGVLVAKTDALVLPVVITGTPLRDSAWASLWSPSRSRVRIMPMVDYRGTPSPQVAADLHARFQRWLAGDGGAVESR